jgi:hypothetical protein
MRHALQASRNNPQNFWRSTLGRRPLSYDRLECSPEQLDRWASRARRCVAGPDVGDAA